jgi:hypothetical protein
VRLIEVCAGSAAVTLAAVGGKLPLYYRGGKRRHARQILTVLQELAASRGAGGFTSFTLNEPGMFGTFWAVVRQTPFRKALVAELRALHKEAQGRTAREFWQALVAAPVPCGIVRRVAVWVALQRHSYGARPVELALEESVTGAWKPDQRWRASGFLGAAADRGAQREAALAAGNRGALRWAKSSPTLADLADAIDALPRALLRPQDGGALHVLRADARRLHLLLADVSTSSRRCPASATAPTTSETSSPTDAARQSARRMTAIIGRAPRRAATRPRSSPRRRTARPRAHPGSSSPRATADRPSAARATLQERRA